MTAPFPTVAGVLERAIANRVFPGAVVEVGRREGAVATIARGSQTYADSATVVADTIYDLASLTKVLATAAL
ncbi:MAG: serine hydrolase, partial [Acidobacteriota bacterium]|nr:serine hydrolase [Acidobacteriota bacterium]